MIHLIAIVLLVCLAIWAWDRIPAPPPVRVAAYVVVFVCCVVYLLRYLPK